MLFHKRVFRISWNFHFWQKMHTTWQGKTMMDSIIQPYIEIHVKVKGICHVASALMVWSRPAPFVFRESESWCWRRSRSSVQTSYSIQHSHGGMSRCTTRATDWMLHCIGTSRQSADSMRIMQHLEHLTRGSSHSRRFGKSETRRKCVAKAIKSFMYIYLHMNTVYIFYNIIYILYIHI